ncbi:alpha/beta fold hydrolase [Pengzhenrongella sicca]|uniref:Alpha/beta hydrolase n=1 Tax=Pengzhenrongella sicca TaxID=2819238 RepID=A0A8A4ZAR0_9MICO|nr:alpha/beta hydrolase [Pengzhenrongella sicca]QTE27973.1 alpha/beta hydrolase [Pengzhenrongella sicca]
MRRTVWTHPARLALLAVAALLALLASLLTSDSAASAPNHRPEPAKPTIVLVHGAFADASGWSEVISSLQKRGYPTYAPANPLRSLEGDSEYLRSFLSTIEGPIVLVGHSYGGAVITNAATGNPNVKALVYIAAFALDEGESVFAALALGGGHSELGDHIVARPYPGAPEGDADIYIDPAFFQALFAADLPAKQAAVLAASQRPGVVSGFSATSGVPAWKTIPSWYLVASSDKTIPPEAERAMAARAGSQTVEIESSHVPMMSHPNAVVRLIKQAASS